jgi:hypothetical protein
MTASCYCDNDYEGFDFCSLFTRVARKLHKCTECNGPIRKGDRYEVVRGLSAGMFVTHKVCPRCLTLRNHLEQSECFCCGYGDLLCMAYERIEELPASPYKDRALRYLAAIRHANTRLGETSDVYLGPQGYIIAIPCDEKSWQ